MPEVGSEENFEPRLFFGHLESVQEECRKRFQEFSWIEPMTKFVVNKFKAVDVSETAILIGNIFQADVGEPELEIINFQSGTVLQSYSKKKYMWKLADGMIYPPPTRDCA
jgi:hypothetical protein